MRLQRIDHRPTPKSHDFGYRSPRPAFSPQLWTPALNRAFQQLLSLIAFLIGMASCLPGFTNEQPPATAELAKHRNSIEQSIATPWDFNPLSLFSPGRQMRFDMPNRPRVSHSPLPLRQVLLATGDRFVAETLKWGDQTADFRLQSGIIIQVPIVAISRISNPPGELDVLVESFEVGPDGKADAKFQGMLDETQAASGRSSLRIQASSKEYQHSVEVPLNAARLEFQFRVDRQDPATDCGEWNLQWGSRGAAATVRVISDGTIRVISVPLELEPTIQTLRLSDGWHTFIGLFTPERTRLIVDDAILASFARPPSGLNAVQFRPVDPSSKNQMWIDDLQIRQIGQPVTGSYSVSQSLDRDMVVMDRSGELFGRIVGVTPQVVILETLGRKRPLPWSRLSELTWSQPASVVQQVLPPRSGVVARIRLQPFVDRADWEPEEWTVTVTSVDTQNLVGQHSLVGELNFPWTEISRIEPVLSGQTQLVDARRFHLGNAIRTDLNRHLPDGTDLKGEFSLTDIPVGRPYFSLEVAELEACGPDAPPASPFLAELRAGHLLTELFINDRSLGSLNEHLRFKPPAERPERIRLPIPRELLKRGQNVFQLRQRPLKPGGREYDDGEVGNFRLDVEK